MLGLDFLCTSARPKVWFEGATLRPEQPSRPTLDAQGRLPSLDNNGELHSRLWVDVGSAVTNQQVEPPQHQQPKSSSMLSPDSEWQTKVIKPTDGVKPSGNRGPVSRIRTFSPINPATKSQQPTHPLISPRNRVSQDLREEIQASLSPRRIAPKASPRTSSGASISKRRRGAGGPSKPNSFTVPRTSIRSAAVTEAVKSAESETGFGSSSSQDQTNEREEVSTDWHSEMVRSSGNVLSRRLFDNTNQIPAPITPRLEEDHSLATPRGDTSDRSSYLVLTSTGGHIAASLGELLKDQKLQKLESRWPVDWRRCPTVLWSNGYIVYYRDELERFAGRMGGLMKLSDSSSVLVDPEILKFTVLQGRDRHMMWEFKADTPEILDSWVDLIRRLIASMKPGPILEESEENRSDGASGSDINSANNSFNVGGLNPQSPNLKASVGMAGRGLWDGKEVPQPTKPNLVPKLKINLAEPYRNSSHSAPLNPPEALHSPSTLSWAPLPTPRRGTPQKPRSRATTPRTNDSRGGSHASTPRGLTPRSQAVERLRNEALRDKGLTAEMQSTEAQNSPRRVAEGLRSGAESLNSSAPPTPRTWLSEDLDELGAHRAPRAQGLISSEGDDLSSDEDSELTETFRVSVSEGVRESGYRDVIGVQDSAGGGPGGGDNGVISRRPLTEGLSADGPDSSRNPGDSGPRAEAALGEGQGNEIRRPAVPDASTPIHAINQHLNPSAPSPPDSSPPFPGTMNQDNGAVVASEARGVDAVPGLAAKSLALGDPAQLSDPQPQVGSLKYLSQLLRPSKGPKTNFSIRQMSDSRVNSMSNLGSKRLSNSDECAQHENANGPGSGSDNAVAERLPRTVSFKGLDAEEGEGVQPRQQGAEEAALGGEPRSPASQMHHLYTTMIYYLRQPQFRKMAIGSAALIAAFGVGLSL